MSFSTNKEREFKWAFVCTEGVLRGIVETLEEMEDNAHIDYTLYLSDDSTITTTNLDDVFSFPNSKQRCIRRIQLRTTGSNNVNVRVSFNNDTFRTVEYEMSGSDDDVLPLSLRLEERLDGLRKWYTIFARHSLLLILIPFEIVLITLMALLVALDTYIYPTLLGEIALPKQNGFLGVLAGSVVLLIPILGLDFARWRLFPVGTFALGQGKDRHDRTEKLRNTILTLLCITLPVGLFFTLF